MPMATWTKRRSSQRLTFRIEQSSRNGLEARLEKPQHFRFIDKPQSFDLVCGDAVRGKKRKSRGLGFKLRAKLAQSILDDSSMGLCAPLLGWTRVENKVTWVTTP